MNDMKWHNAFSYALGNLEVRCECMTRVFLKMNMVAKGISQDDFPENGVGRWSYNNTSEELMYCFGRFSNTFPSEGSLIFLPTLR